MAIIAISGKMQSGKDTVASIIQYLTNPFDRDMKTEFNFNEDYSAGSQWRQKAFAHKVKQIGFILTGIPVEDLEKQEVKDSFLTKEWNLNGGVDPFQIRLFLQRLGTDAMRDVVHPNCWTNALFADYKPIGDNLLEGEVRKVREDDLIYPNWIITDMRFPNELEAVKDRGGITIRVNRWIDKELSKKQALDLFQAGKEVYYIDDNGCEGLCEDVEVFDSTWSRFVTQKDYSNHISETALDSATFDYVIENNSSIEDLIEKVKEILIKENILSSKQ